MEAADDGEYCATISGYRATKARTEVRDVRVQRDTVQTAVSHHLMGSTRWVCIIPSASGTPSLNVSSM